MKISLRQLERLSPPIDLIKRFKACTFAVPSDAPVDLFELMGPHWRAPSHAQELRLGHEHFLWIASQLLERVDLVQLAVTLAKQVLNKTGIESHIGLRESFADAHKAIAVAERWIVTGTAQDADKANDAYDECHYCYANANHPEAELIYYACCQAAYCAYLAHHADKDAHVAGSVIEVIESIAEMDDYHNYWIHNQLRELFNGKTAEEKRPLHGRPIMKWLAVSTITLAWVAFWMIFGFYFIMGIQTTNKDYALLFGGLTFYSVWKTLKIFKLD